MNSNDEAELFASVYQRMTGRLAPFKDSAAAAGPRDTHAEIAVYDEWLHRCYEPIKWTIAYFERTDK